MSDDPARTGGWGELSWCGMKEEEAGRTLRGRAGRPPRERWYLSHTLTHTHILTHRIRCKQTLESQNKYAFDKQNRSKQIGWSRISLPTFKNNKSSYYLPSFCFCFYFPPRLSWFLVFPPQHSQNNFFEKIAFLNESKSSSSINHKQTLEIYLLAFKESCLELKERKANVVEPP